jgi:hypothetical protein
MLKIQIQVIGKMWEAVSIVAQILDGKEMDYEAMCLRMKPIPPSLLH